MLNHLSLEIRAFKLCLTLYFDVLDLETFILTFIMYNVEAILNDI